MFSYHQRGVPVAGRLRQSAPVNPDGQGGFGSSIENLAGNSAGGVVSKKYARHCRGHRPVTALCLYEVTVRSIRQVRLLSRPYKHISQIVYR